MIRNMSTAGLYEAVARVGQALSSGTRLKMLELPGLVTSRGDGRSILYRP